MADALETLSLIYQARFHNEAPLIQIERRDMLVHYQSVEQEVNGKPLFHDIKYYLQK